MERRLKELLNGPGFYGVLALCILAVGIGGYFFLLRETPENTPQEEADLQAAAPVENLPDYEHTPEPVDPEEPEVTLPEETVPVSMPEETVPVSDTPVVPAEPQVVVTPLQGDVVTVFSVDQLLYNETLEDWRTHDGVDLAAAAGDAVVSACAGTVETVYEDPLMGTTVTIRHQDGYVTTYANLQTDPPVTEGEQVAAGQTVGVVGTTAVAEAAQGPHLHFAVTRDGEPVDPEAFLNS